jgi:hypothetical protein
MTTEDIEETRKKRAKLSAALAPLKQKLGCATLTDLWRDVEEQIDEDTVFGSNRPPRMADEYLSGLPFASKRALAMRLREGKGPLSEQEAKELEQSRLWRGLRLGSRQYLHLYGKAVTDTQYSVGKLTADVKEDERWEEEIKENGGKVPEPKVVEVSLTAETEPTSPEAKSSLESNPNEKSEFTADEGVFQVSRNDSDVEMKEGEHDDAIPADKEASEVPKDEAEPIVISLTSKEAP